MKWEEKPGGEADALTPLNGEGGRWGEGGLRLGARPVRALVPRS